METIDCSYRWGMSDDEQKACGRESTNFMTPCCLSLSSVALTTMGSRVKPVKCVLSLSHNISVWPLSLAIYLVNDNSLL